MNSKRRNGAPVIPQQSREAVQVAMAAKGIDLDAMAKAQNDMIKSWLIFIIMGIFRDEKNAPKFIKLHGSGTRLYVRTVWVRPMAIASNAEQTEEKDLILHNTPNYAFNPASKIEVIEGSLGPAWPPAERIQQDVRRDRELAEESQRRIQLAGASDIKKFS